MAQKLRVSVRATLESRLAVHTAIDIFVVKQRIKLVFDQQPILVFRIYRQGEVHVPSWWVNIHP